MYTCIIIEDEPVFAQQLSDYIAQTNMFGPPVVCSTAMEAFAAMSKTTFDFVFLDCYLPDMNGIDLIKQFTRLSKVIITTAHPNMAADCYDIDEIIDYLVKPYEFPRFLRAVRRGVAEEIPATWNQQEASEKSDKKIIYLKAGRTFARFVVDEIQHVEAYGAYVKVFTSHGFTAINQRLSSLLKELESEKFIRVHKSFIVNTEFLTKIDANKLFIGPIKIPIGITYRIPVVKHFQKMGIIDKNRKPKK